MIDKPSLLDNPNLVNWKEYTVSATEGASVDDCYGNNSAIRDEYDGTDTNEWNTGKQVQDTLPASEWDAFMHDVGAFGWQMTSVVKSIWEELYSAIHGQQQGMSHELLDVMVSSSSVQTLTNKTIDYSQNTMPGVQPTLIAGSGIDITGTTISTKQTYSTSEQLTGGVWVDGKPIYRKTLVVNDGCFRRGMTSDYGGQASCSIAPHLVELDGDQLISEEHTHNIETVISCSGFYESERNNNRDIYKIGETYDQKAYAFTTSTGQTKYLLEATLVKSYISAHKSANSTEASVALFITGDYAYSTSYKLTAYVTLEYTKTTD